MNDDHLRLSDEERDRAAAELGEHYAQGRLDSAEHAERLDRVWAARTRGDLPGIFRDLPGTSFGRGPARLPFGSFPTPATGPISGPASGPPAGLWSRPSGVRSWHHGVPGPLLALLAVLVVLTVATHLPLFLVGLVVFLLVRSRRRHQHSHHGGYGWGPGGRGGWGHPTR